jgi:adenosylcobinamide kinase/adenosylcobinamide-phosphate guanylyltransferase
MFPRLSLVLGGARSGKSALAERLVALSGGEKIYLATGQGLDEEMAERIARHRAARGPGWHTIEEPRAVAAALGTLREGQTVLLDCASLWLSNHLLNGSDIAAEMAALEEALDACPARVVVVSGEAGMGIVPENALARRFRDEQGLLNQRLAARASLVVAAIAGLPLVLKGALPEGLS